MQHDEAKEKEKSSLIGKIISLEALFFVMGCVLLGYGIVNNDEMTIFFSIVIIPGVFILHKVRKKDWKKHWAEMEAEQKQRLEYMERKKELKEQQAKQDSK